MNIATTVLKHTIAHLGNHGGTQIWTQLEKTQIDTKAWTTEQNREEKHKLWQKFKTEQRSFNLYTRKVKRRYIKERQIYLLMTKASNVKKFWKEIHQYTTLTSPNKGKTAVCGSPTFFAG